MVTELQGTRWFINLNITGYNYKQDPSLIVDEDGGLAKAHPYKTSDLHLNSRIPLLEIYLSICQISQCSPVRHLHTISLALSIL